MEPLLEVRDLKVYYPVFGNFLQRLLGGGQTWVHAVDNISFDIGKKEILGLVGESGSGKSTVGRALLQIVRPTSGMVVFEGKDLGRLKFRQLMALRERIQIIYQDPHAALNPSMTVGETLGETLRTHWKHVSVMQAGGYDVARPDDVPRPKTEEIVHRSHALLTDVGLTPPEQFFGKLPSEISGGQKQRVVIARAISLRPRLIVADEPVALLDMSIRAKVLELLLDLRERYGIAFLFITHDLATAKLICERVAIMYLGQIVEVGPTRSVYSDPKHPYTKALLQAIPVPDPAKRTDRILPKGEVPDAVTPPQGCRFHPRCPVATPTCGWEGKDVLDLLDQRAIDRTVAKRDYENLGPISRMELSDTGLVFPRGVDPEGMRRYAEALVTTAPPALAGAVEEVFCREDRVEIRFKSTKDPGARTVGDREVRCVLY